MDEQSAGSQTMEPQVGEVTTEERPLTVDEEIAELEKLLSEEPEAVKVKPTVE